MMRTAETSCQTHCPSHMPDAMRIVDARTDGRTDLRRISLTLGRNLALSNAREVAARLAPIQRMSAAARRHEAVPNA
jgi:hypothetical protein